jgi:hypothetical protein
MTINNGLVTDDALVLGPSQGSRAADATVTSPDRYSKVTPTQEPPETVEIARVFSRSPRAFRPRS